MPYKPLPTGSELQTAQTLAHAYLQKLNLQQSAFFPHIKPKLLLEQIQKRIDNQGESISQGGHFLCGAATVAHLVAKYQPEVYAQTVTDLYQKAATHKEHISCHPSLGETLADTNGFIAGIPAVDWLLLNALRESENALNWGTYQATEQGYVFNKASLKAELKDLMKRMQSELCIVAEGGIQDLGWTRNTLIPRLQNYALVVFIDSKAYKNENYESWLHQTVSQHYGRHFALIKALDITPLGKITKLELWDYAATKNLLKHTTPKGDLEYHIRDFKGFKEHTKYFWLIGRVQ